MRMEVVTVTPDQAEHWLATSVALPNRAITQRRVSAYASAMVRGQWRVTHQAIAIDPEGVLVDGQHRLSAVVAAGIPVAMMVAFDVDRALFDVIDTGFARTTASALHIAGVADPNAIAAAARMMLAYDLIGGTRRMMHSDLRAAASTRDILNFVQSERGVTLRGAMPVARSIAQTLSQFGVRTWLGAAIAIVDETTPDREIRGEFLDKLFSGAMLPATSPILTLRKWIVSDTGYRRIQNAARGPFGIAAYIKTWNAYTQGKDMHLVRFQPGREVWPLPGADPVADDADPEDAAA